MRRVLLAFLLAFLPGMIPAQEVTAPPAAPPVDEAAQGAGFAAYRARLLEAVVARDVDAIVDMADPEIALNFGGKSGHAGLRAFLTVPTETFSEARRFEAPALRERNWTDLETVLRMGGVFEGEGRFVAPYTRQAPVPEGMDPYEVMFVTGTGVALRDRPIRYGEVVARLDHEVVRLGNWVSGTPYVGVTRLDAPDAADGTQGFVHQDYLRALVDYHAVFERRDGAWRLTAFLAGP